MVRLPRECWKRPKSNNLMIYAIAKYARISPKKVRSLANEVKKLRIDDALNVLTFSPKNGAKYIKEVLESAIANAKNNFKIDKSNLLIKSIDVNGGTFFKRWRAVSKGGAHEYKKRTSHIKVVLDEIKKIPVEVKKEVKARQSGA